MKADLENKRRGEEKEPGIEVARKKKTYQIDRASIWPHGEAVNMLRLKITGNCSPDSGHNLVIRRSLETSKGELSGDGTPGPISSILNGRDIKGRTLR